MIWEKVKYVGDFCYYSERNKEKQNEKEILSQEIMVYKIFI